jgi:hypothetical protein
VFGKLAVAFTSLRLADLLREAVDVVDHHCHSALQPAESLLYLRTQLPHSLLTGGSVALPLECLGKGITVRLTHGVAHVASERFLHVQGGAYQVALICPDPLDELAGRTLDLILREAAPGPLFPPCLASPR